MTDHPRNILTIRIDNVGDLVLATPALRHMRESWPGARLSVLVSPWNAPVLEGWDAVDELIEYDRGWPLRRRIDALADLRRRRFDVALVLSPVFAAYVAAAWTGAPVRAGVVYSTRQPARVMAPWLLTRASTFHLDEAVAAGRPVPHEVEQSLEVLSSVGLPARPRPLELPRRAADREWAEVFAAARFREQPYIALHLSGHWIATGGSGDNLAALIHALSTADRSTAILVTHGPRDRAVFDALAHALTFDAQPCDSAAVHCAANRRIVAAGQLAFGRWAALLAGASVVITRDTGALHVAAAAGRPIVAVYESATFAHCSQQWAPWMVPHRSLRAGPWPALARAITDAVDALLAETDTSWRRTPGKDRVIG